MKSSSALLRRQDWSETGWAYGSVVPQQHIYTNQFNKNLHQTVFNAGKQWKRLSTKTECDYLYGWIKNSHIRKNLTKSGEPQRSSWGMQKKKRKWKRFKKPSPPQSNRQNGRVFVWRPLFIALKSTQKRDRLPRLHIALYGGKSTGWTSCAACVTIWHCSR